jgi:FeS assembly SUF system protein
MSFPLNNSADTTDAPGAADAGTPAPAGAGASITGDPLAMLKFKPEIVGALSTIFDPEIPVNIYELGLIYDVIVSAEHAAEIRMTLTAPGCPAAQSLPVQVEQRVRAVEGITDVKVEVVWDPPWTKDHMSDAAKLQLGLF